MRDSITLALLGAALVSGIFAADAVTATGAMLVCAIVLIATVVVLAKRLHPERLSLDRPSFKAREWVGTALPLTIIMSADVLMSRSGVLVLGLRGNTLDAGIFAVAFNIAALTVLPRMAIANLFAPTVSELYSKGDTAGLQALVAQASSLCLIASVCVAVPIIAAAPSLMALFGPKFTAGTEVLMVLVAGQLFVAALGPQQHLVTMTGHEWAGAAMMGSFACVNFIGGLLLAGPFGMVGAAAAVAGSVIAWNIAMAWFVWRKLGLRPGLIAARRRNSPEGSERR